MCSYKCAGVTIILLGILLIAIGLVMGFVGTPQILAHEFDNKIIPDTDADGLAEFSKGSKMPMFEAFHVFNLTNSDLWMAGTAKPSVMDLGSYTMQVDEKNLDPIVADDDCSITFTRNRTYWLRPDESTRSDLDAVVYNLNPFLLDASVLFDGVVPAVQGILLPNILKMTMTQLSNVTSTSGRTLTPESMASQFATLEFSRFTSTSDSFENAPGIFDLMSEPENNVTTSLINQFDFAVPINFIAEPAAFFRDYPGKQITIKDNDGAETLLSIPGRMTVWPMFSGFTEEEGVMFYNYLNGSLIDLQLTSPLTLPLAMVLATQGQGGDGLIDEYVRMAKGDPNDLAKMPEMAAKIFTTMNFTSMPCQGNQTDVCQRLAAQLNAVDGPSVARLWMMTVLNDYFAQWTNFALKFLDNHNGGLVIKGTVRDWLWGFEPMAGMAVRGIIRPGPERFTRTMNTGKCDRNEVGTWKSQDGKSYVDPKLYPFSCPDSMHNDSAAANCDALHVHGYDGTQFPPASLPIWSSRRPNKDEYRVWIAEMNRDLAIANTHNDLVVDDITLNHFVMSPDALAANAYNNIEYFGVTCDGLLEGPSMVTSFIPGISSAKNILLGFSRPHFLFADATCTSDLVDGLSADADLHDTFADIEPYSGTTMQLRKRLQANLLPKSSIVGAIDSKALNLENGEMTAQVWSGPYALLAYAPIPYYFVERRAMIAKEMADDFRGMVFLSLKITFILMIALPIVGVLLIIAGIVMLRKARYAATHYGGMYLGKEKW